MIISAITRPVVLSILLFASVSAISDPTNFMVTMRVVDAGVELATPQMLVKEGSKASMNLSGENSVAMGLVVNSLSDNQARVMAEVETANNIMSPELLVRKGEWASVSVGELEFHIRVENHVADK